MERLYYILAISVKGNDAWSKPELCFVGFQWLIFFCCPILLLDNLSYSENIDWYTFDLGKTFLFFSIPLLVFLNHLLFFRNKQTNKIIDKYRGRYYLIDKYPIGAYFIFHLVLPILLFIIFLFIPTFL